MLVLLGNASCGRASILPVKRDSRQLQQEAAGSKPAPAKTSQEVTVAPSAELQNGIDDIDPVGGR